MGAIEKGGGADSVRPSGPAASGGVRPEEEPIAAEQGERAFDGDASGGRGEVGGVDKRVFTRDEFASLLMERSGDVTKVGGVMAFVESVLKLQNDMTRPVYVFQVKDGITSDDIAMLDMEMEALGVACVLIPAGTLTYVGEVTSESYGQRNLRTEVFGIKGNAHIRRE